MPADGSVDNIQQMRHLREQGHSYGVIAKLYGLSRQRVHQLVSGYGLNNRLLHHNDSWYKRLHDSIMVRDNQLCQKCSTTDHLLVHHIDGNDNNNASSNLITLCQKCHMDTHRPKGGLPSSYKGTGYTVKQAARLLGFSPSYIYLLIRLGELRAEKIGAQYVISGEEVERYTARRSNAQPITQ